MKIYLSGPMTGITDFNHPEFNRVAALLRTKGHQVINPADLDLVDPVDSGDWHDFLRRDVKYLCDAEAVVLLDDWAYSRGSRLEMTVAVQLDMPIYKLDGEELCDMKIEGALNLEIYYTPPIPLDHINITLKV